MEDVSYVPSLASATNHARACTICAKAKAKCIPSPNPDGSCERCARLNKYCQKAAPQPRKRRVAKSTSRVSQLEEKLDGLVMLLTSSQNGPQESILGRSLSTPVSDPPTSSSITLDNPEMAWHTSNNCGANVSHIPSAKDFSARITGTFTPGSTPSTTSTIISSKGLEISPQDATKFLVRFRLMADYFPFVLIAPEITAEQLRNERPFVFRSIMATACRDPIRQMHLSQEFRRELCERVLIKGERNIDILLGILIHAGWCHYHFHMVPQLSNLISLAMSVCFDLGFNKRPPGDYRTGHIVDDALRQGFHGGPIRPGARTLEEQRATIGCYYLSSVASAYFQKIDPMRWTSYMDECVNNLAAAPEYRSDLGLGCMIKLQHMTDRMRQSPWYETYESSESLKVPPAFFVNSLEAQLRDFHKSIPPDLIALVLMQYHTVAFSIYEISLSKSPLLANYSSKDFQRLENLYSCLSSLQSWFNLFFAIPTTLYYSFGTATCTQLAHALIIFAKITTFECPDWDLMRVREIMDFNGTIDNVIQHFESAAEAAEMDCPLPNGQDAFSRTANKLRKVKTWFEAKLAVDSMAPEITAPSTANMNEIMADANFDIDENFLQDILGDWAYNMDNYPTVM